MKHLIFAALLVFVSCKDNKTRENDTKTDVFKESVEVTHQDHDDKTTNVYTNAWISKIELNNGSKWQANAETNEGIQKMKKNIKNQTTSTLDDYYTLADMLNDDKNYVIKNCTMKGASHDNLHVWLLPLIEKIEALSKANTLEEASKLKQSIEENVNAYSNYFE